MSRKNMISIGQGAADELAREFALDEARKPFYDFVHDTLGVVAGDFVTISDERLPDGWRVIDLKVFLVSGGTYLSTIYLPPSTVKRFPARLDFPF